MIILKKIVLIALVGAFVFSLSGCTAKVGSKRWCSDMKAKPKGDWTVNEAADFAKYCILK